MTKARINRIRRLMALRLQQRRIQEMALSQARNVVDDVTDRRQTCVNEREALNQQHNACLAAEVDPADLAALLSARNLVCRRIDEANEDLCQAKAEADVELAELLSAHRAHRSIELVCDRAMGELRKELAKAEQRELDDIASTGLRRRHR